MYHNLYAIDDNVELIKNARLYFAAADGAEVEAENASEADGEAKTAAPQEAGEDGTTEDANQTQDGTA